MIELSKVEQYLTEKKGITRDYKEEWGWFRFMIGGKMFAAICTPSSKYAPEYAEKLLLTLKCSPDKTDYLESVCQDILPGFYMDKRNWISIRLNGEIEEELVYGLIDDAYSLVFNKLTKKMQKDITDKTN